MRGSSRALHTCGCVSVDLSYNGFSAAGAPSGASLLPPIGASGARPPPLTPSGARPPAGFSGFSTGRAFSSCLTGAAAATVGSALGVWVAGGVSSSTTSIACTASPPAGSGSGGAAAAAGLAAAAAAVAWGLSSAGVAASSAFACAHSLRGCFQSLRAAATAVTRTLRARACGTGGHRDAPVVQGIGLPLSIHRRRCRHRR